MGHLSKWGFGEIMSKKHDSVKNSKKAMRPKFKVAYSINNWQPVQSTHISDQPFFYMDESYDDDMFEDEFSGEFYDEDLSKIMSQIQAFDAAPKSKSDLKQNRQNEFSKDSEFITENFVCVENDIKDVTALFGQTNYGEALLNFASQKDIKIQFGVEGQKSSYDEQAQKLFIDPNLETLEQVILLTMELRRAWQTSQGANINPLTINPDHAILINRAQKADLSVAVIRVAWELKLQNQKELWTRLTQSSLSDLVYAFAREAKTDFRTLNSGKAASAVFETWFLSERCAYEDSILVQQMLADHKNYSYEPKDNSELLAIKIISAIGAQPVGKNYLHDYAHFIVSDGLFTETRDRSTANFLWFIKFEHRFQETERQLQSSELIKITDTQPYQNKKIFEDTPNEHTAQTGSNVVALFAGRYNAQTQDHLQ